MRAMTVIAKFVPFVAQVTSSEKMRWFALRAYERFAFAWNEILELVLSWLLYMHMPNFRSVTPASSSIN